MTVCHDGLRASPDRGRGWSPRPGGQSGAARPMGRAGQLDGALHHFGRKAYGDRAAAPGLTEDLTAAVRTDKIPTRYRRDTDTGIRP